MENGCATVKVFAQTILEKVGTENSTYYDISCRVLLSIIIILFAITFARRYIIGTMLIAYNNN